MSIASAAPFSGLSLPAKTAPSPAASDQGTERVGTYGGRMASTRGTLRPGLAWNADTQATAGGCLPWAACRSAAAIAASGSSGGVDMHLVASADQAARKVGHEGLRASALRLADG